MFSAISVVIFVIIVFYFTSNENVKKFEKQQAEYEYQLKQAEEEMEKMRASYDREVERLYERLEKYE